MVSYFVGAIPTGYILGKFLLGVDVRKLGSGNIGATNVSRVSGKRWLFLVVFLLDFFKAFFVVAVAARVVPSLMVLCALLVLLGNGYSCFIGFRGGKGISTSLGIVAAINPFVLLIGFLSWVFAFYFFKIASVASLAFLSMVLCSALVMPMNLGVRLLFVFIFAWSTWRHRENLKLLWRGEEE